MMEKYFNLSRYKELLQLEEKGIISFLDLELVTYKASVAQQIQYNRKKDYFIVIHEYLSQIITPYEFRSKFLQMQKDDSAKAALILQNDQELEVFTLAKDLEKFSNLISEISTLWLEFAEVWDGTMELMSESEFYSLVNNNYLQLQEAFPFGNFNNQAYEHLVDRSFKILMFTIVFVLLILFNIYIIN